jgi:membrane protein implicated in regulation of membrane protease activity
MRWWWLGLAALLVAALLVVTMRRGLRRHQTQTHQEGNRCCVYYGARQVTCWPGLCR